jgi:hypothetical protein
MSVNNKNLYFILLIFIAMLVSGCTDDSGTSDGGSILSGVVSGSSSSSNQGEASVTGKVYSSDENLALPNASVQIKGMPAAYTDNQGNFSVRGIDLNSLAGINTAAPVSSTAVEAASVLLESYKADVTVSAPGFENKIMTITLLRGRNINFEVRLVKIQDALITGIVKDKDTGLPLGGVKISIDAEGGAEFFTSETGTYRISDIDPGNYFISHFLPGYFNSVIGITLESGVNRLDVSLSSANTAGASLHGRILDSRDSSPIENAKIQIGSSSVFSGRASDELIPGYYLIDNVVPGFHYISVTAEGYLTKLIGITIEFGRNLLDVSLVSEVYNTDIRGDLVGTVVGSDFKLKAGVEIIVGAYRQSPIEYTGITGASGWYQIHAVPLGSYTVTARMPGVTNEADIVIENFEITRSLNVLNLSFSEDTKK